MRLRFLWIGETKNSQYADLEADYLKRIQMFYSAEAIAIPELKKSDRRSVTSQLEREGQLLEKRIQTSTFLIALDENGKQCTSCDLSKKLNQWMNRGINDITFLVGGHLGLPPYAAARANMVLSLSRMTLPHELARVVIVEQVYRAISILKGLPYHK